MSSNIAAEAARRRTFAIISHPDAGKTTMTEKLLLYGGAIHLAGAVRGRRAARHATSDWMAIERERGISVSTSVLQFEFQGLCINLLDTPGHNDFSEDTYRTLAAADCALMLIDAAKGVEPQTIKLFEVCRTRNIPIVTFINKMDRPGLDPLELLDQVEDVLGIPTTPAVWPVGTGDEFRGIYDRWNEEFLVFEQGLGGARPVPFTVAHLNAGGSLDGVPDRLAKTLAHDVELLSAAAAPFDRKMFLAGRQTPVFFGSALTNFGVERFLEHFGSLCPAPGPRQADEGLIPVDLPSFTGFVFKIQANMDPQHRDRIAFVRVCSGRFERGMDIRHSLTGKPIAVNRAMKLRSRERSTIEEAFPGDIVGIWDPGMLHIGDTLYEDKPVHYAGIPRFSPEHFVRVRLQDPFKRKQLKKGLEELSEEGAVQLFYPPDRPGQDAVLGAVGLLQFDVVRHRLKAEYGVESLFETLPFQIARWVVGGYEKVSDLQDLTDATCLVDLEGRPLLLFKSDFQLRWLTQHNPEVVLSSSVAPARKS